MEDFQQQCKSFSNIIAVYLSASLISMFATIKSYEEAIAEIAILEGELPTIIPFVATMHLLYIAGYIIAVAEVKKRRSELAPPIPAYPPYSGPPFSSSESVFPKTI